MRRFYLLIFWIGCSFADPILPLAQAQSEGKKSLLKQVLCRVCNACTAEKPCDNEEDSGPKHTLLFSEQGELLSAPPDVLYPGDALKFSIQKEDDAYNERVIEMTERIVETLNKLGDIENLKHFGINEKEIGNLKAGLRDGLYQLRDDTEISEDTRLHITSRLFHLPKDDILDNFHNRVQRVTEGIKDNGQGELYVIIDKDTTTVDDDNWINALSKAFNTKKPNKVALNIAGRDSTVTNGKGESKMMASEWSLNGTEAFNMEVVVSLIQAIKSLILQPNDHGEKMFKTGYRKVLSNISSDEINIKITLNDKSETFKIPNINRHIPDGYISVEKKHELKYQFSYRNGGLDAVKSEVENLEFQVEKDKEIEKAIFEIRELDHQNATIRNWYLQDGDNPLKFPDPLANSLLETRSVLSSEKFKTSLKTIEDLSLKATEEINELNDKIKEINKKEDEPDTHPDVERVKEGIKATKADCEEGQELVKSLKEKAKTKNLFEILKKSNSKNWILNWLWLTRGIPKINPFPHQAQPLLFDLEIEKAKLEFYRQKLENKDTKAENAEEVADMVKAMAKARKNIEMYGNLEAFIKDDFLYRGELVVSGRDGKFVDKRGTYYMLHHNARNSHLNMKTDFKKEILETEKMAVLVHNKDPEVHYNLVSTFTSIADDPTLLERDWPDHVGFAKLADLISKNTDKGSDVKGVSQEEKDINQLINEANELGKEANRACECFQKAYINLVNDLEFIHTLQMPPNLPLLLVADRTPNLESKILDYDLDASKSPPYTHEYQITDNEDEVKYKGNYRINKLYRFRAKVGPMYSRLTRNDYTISANEVTMTQNRHRFDFTAGVQYYFKKYDIRQRNITCKDGWFAYLGMGLMNKPLENWMLGGGYEWVPGVTTTFGGHFGVDERLNTDRAGNLFEQSKVKIGLFGAITFDLAVFQSFFGISGLFN